MAFLIAIYLIPCSIVDRYIYYPITKKSFIANNKFLKKSLYYIFDVKK